MCYAGGVCVPGSRKNLGVSVLPASGRDERCSVRVAGGGLAVEEKNIPARLGGAGRGCRMWCDVSLFVFEHRIPSGQLYRVESGELEYVLWDIFLVHYKSEQVFVQPLVGHNQMPLEA